MSTAVPEKVIVIGAGLSGLGCAWELRAHGVGIVVLEGKDVVGGRVYTDSSGLDLAAHWLHGGGEGGPSRPTPESAVHAAAAAADEAAAIFSRNTNCNSTYASAAVADAAAAAEAAGTRRDALGYLHPDVNPLRTLCDAWGIVTKPTGGDSTYIGGRRPPGAPRKAGIAFYNPDGSRLSAAGEKRLWDVYEEFEKEEGEYVATLAENNDDKLVSDVHAMVLANKKPPLSETDLRFLQWHIESEYGGDWGNDPADLKSSTYHNAVDGQYFDYTGPDRIIVGGFKSLLDKLVEGIEGVDGVGAGTPVSGSGDANGDCSSSSSSSHGSTAASTPKSVFRYGAAGRVVRIEHGFRHADNGEGSRAQGKPFVAVHTADGTVYSGDAAVITVPLGVLQRTAEQSGHIAFSPPLPAWKRDAITRGFMGNLNKLILEFEACYWPAEQYSFGYINFEANMLPSMIVNLMPTHGKPILVFMVGGSAGRSFERRSEIDNEYWAMTLVRKLFGKHVPDPVGSKQTAWDQDPMAFGSYSSAGLLSKKNDRALLREPVSSGALYFAGEHCSDMHFGCAHGALLTGLEQAMAITGSNQCFLASNPLDSSERPRL